MSTRIADLCIRNVVAVAPTATVAEAAELMRKHHVGALVIAAQSGSSRAKPLGIVTDRDIVVEVVAARLDGDRITVGEITQRALVTVDANASAADAVREMTVAGVRRLPVIAADGALLGIVTMDDLLPGLVAPLVAIGDLAARERRFEVHSRVA